MNTLQSIVSPVRELDAAKAVYITPSPSYERPVPRSQVSRLSPGGREVGSAGPALRTWSGFQQPLVDGVEVVFLEDVTVGELATFGTRYVSREPVTVSAWAEAVIRCRPDAHRNVDLGQIESPGLHQGDGIVDPTVDAFEVGGDGPFEIARLAKAGG